MVDFELAEKYSLEDLARIVKILRAPGGCPWDAEQTHKSIRDDLLEESCEAMEAIDLGDMELLREELGDVLLQVVFHASLAEQDKQFDLSGVITGVCRKLITRHPHVFGDVTADGVDGVLANWEAIKRRQHGKQTIEQSMRGVAKTLPPIMRAGKLKRLAKRANIQADSHELDAAVAALEESQQALNDACERYITSCNRGESPLL
ncbi:hypothetical protein FACS1894217_04240 [Clostridia bacterium]|nr:hypothetical protein FACS1894217_04240 [Clostridia bacterium]